MRYYFEDFTFFFFFEFFFLLLLIIKYYLYLCFHLLCTQTLLAINELTKAEIKGKPHQLQSKPLDYSRLLVISLGCGNTKGDGTYNANIVNQWSTLGWFIQPSGRMPIFEMFSRASTDMVDYHASLVFQSFGAEHNYLRVQVHHIIYTFVD